MVAIDVADDVHAPDLARRALLEQRLVVNATGPATIRLEPPLVVSEEQIDEALRAGSERWRDDRARVPARPRTRDPRRGWPTRSPSTSRSPMAVRARPTACSTTRLTACCTRPACSAARESGQLALIDRDSGDVSVRRRMAPPTKPLLPSELEPGPLRDALVPVVDVRALLPLVRVQMRERPLTCSTTNARRRADDARGAGAGRRARPAQAAARAAAARRRCAATRGARPGPARARARARLPAPADQPLRRRGGSRRRASDPGGIASKIDVPLLLDAAIRRAPRRGCCGDCSRSSRPTSRARSPTSTREFLHDFRVSVRRSRSVQRELKGVFRPTRSPASAPSSVGFSRSPAIARPRRLRARVRRDASDRAGGDARRPRPAAGRCSRAAASRPARAMARRAALRTRATSLLVRWSSFLDGLGRASRRRPPRRGAADRRASPASGSARSIGGWSRWARRSTTRARPRTTTSCARRARSFATCSSCSAPRCTRPTSSSR